MQIFISITEFPRFDLSSIAHKRNLAQMHSDREHKTKFIFSCVRRLVSHDEMHIRLTQATNDISLHRSPVPAVERYQYPKFISSYEQRLIQSSGSAWLGAGLIQQQTLAK